MTEFTGWGRNNDIDFGDYVEIEQFRYGVPNEMFIHKVVGAFKSNAWVEVPVRWDKEKKVHDHSEKVLNVICCGIDETKVYRVKESDCTKVANPLEQENARLREEIEKLHILIQQTLNEFKAHVIYSSKNDAAYFNLIKKIGTERKQLREALEFYADEENYTIFGFGLKPELDEIHNVDVDKGEKARQALEGVTTQ